MEKLSATELIPLFQPPMGLGIAQLNTFRFEKEKGFRLIVPLSPGYWDGFDMKVKLTILKSSALFVNVGVLFFTLAVNSHADFPATITTPGGVIVMESDGTPRFRATTLNFANCTVTQVSNSSAVITCAGGSGSSGGSLTYFNGTQSITISTFSMPGVQTVSLNGNTTFYIPRSTFAWTGAQTDLSSTVLVGPVHIGRMGYTGFVPDGGEAWIDHGLLNISSYNAQPTFPLIAVSTHATSNKKLFTLDSGSMTYRGKKLAISHPRMGTTGGPFNPQIASIQFGLNDDENGLNEFQIGGSIQLPLSFYDNGIRVLNVGTGGDLNMPNASSKFVIGDEVGAGDAKFRVHNGSIASSGGPTGLSIGTYKFNVHSDIDGVSIGTNTPTVSLRINMESATPGFLVTVGTVTILSLSPDTFELGSAVTGLRMQNYIVTIPSAPPIGGKQVFAQEEGIGVWLPYPSGSSSLQLPCSSCTINDLHTTSVTFHNPGVSTISQTMAADYGILQTSRSTTNIPVIRFTNIPNNCSELWATLVASAISASGKPIMARINDATTNYVINITSSNNTDNVTFSTGSQGSGLNAAPGIYFWTGRVGISANDQPVSITIYDLQNTQQSPKMGRFRATAMPNKYKVTNTVVPMDFTPNRSSGDFGYFGDPGFISSISFLIYGDPNTTNFVAPITATLRCSQW